jgi:uncharacterized protein YegL
MTNYSDVEVVRENLVVEGQVIMPFYLLVDVSSSMRGDEQQLNTALAELVQAIVKDPVVDDLVMLSMITFNHAAETVVPLSSPSEISLPTVRASGGTRYAAAFEEFQNVFDRDKAVLRQRGIKVYRPCVFFLTDGEPGDLDSYLEAFRALFAYDPEARTGNKAFPYFVPFGFRDARADVIRSLAYPDFGATKGRWFLISSNDVGDVLQTIADVLGRTVVSAGQSVSQGNPTLVPPVPAEGSSGVQFGDAGDFVE